MKLLLINPRSPESFWSLKWALETFVPNVRTLSPPLGLATVAGLTPRDWDVEIIDENIEPVPLETDADVVGVCGMGVQFDRQRELLSYYRDRGHFVVAGGSYASLCPEHYEGICDSVVSGEAERTWPEFCRDFRRGRQRSLYRETESVALALSPTPRFDLLHVERYAWMGMQFSRGCPYRCEFCDIIVMFGRRPRLKSIAQIESELDAMRALGARNIFFVDDNLVGNIKEAKRLLRFLADYQSRHDYYFKFGTEGSLNLAGDPELLELLRMAHFDWVFIGIESPDTACLEEVKKTQNTRRDMLSSIREIYRHGIDVTAGFIIGFDNDTTEVFDKQYRFIVDSGIQRTMIGLLLAIEKTPLYDRLAAEGRLSSKRSSVDNVRLSTNLVPKQMTYDEMITGYRRLYDRLLRFGTIARRIKNKTRYLKTPLSTKGRPLWSDIVSCYKIIRHVVADQGIAGLWHLLGSIPVRRPQLLSHVMQDWVYGLSMRDYVARYFAVETERERRLVSRRLDQIKAALAVYIDRGRLHLMRRGAAGQSIEVSLQVRGRMDRAFFKRATRHLDRLLRDTRSRLVLEIHDFDPHELPSLERMLARLSRYQDRIRIAMDDASRRIIRPDSSIFNVRLAPVSISGRPPAPPARPTC